MPNNNNKKSLVNSKEDFENVPDGGCSLPCGFRLKCDHVCQKACHILDNEHLGQYNQCNKSCDKIFKGCNHKCTKICHGIDECGPCMAKMAKKRTCGHLILIEYEIFF